MPASKAQQAATAKRRASAIALKLAGMDPETIAERLDYSDPGAVRKDIWRAFHANRLEEKQKVEELRHLEGLRLDRLQASVWPKALKGDLKAVETVRRLITERIRLFGLAEPVRTELSGPGGGPLQMGPTSAAELNALIGHAGDGEDEDPLPEDLPGEDDSDGDDDLRD